MAADRRGFIGGSEQEVKDNPLTATPGEELKADPGVGRDMFQIYARQSDLST
jgi:hypothetical protein